MELSRMHSADYTSTFVLSDVTLALPERVGPVLVDYVGDLGGLGLGGRGRRRSRRQPVAHLRELGRRREDGYGRLAARPRVRLHGQQVLEVEDLAVDLRPRERGGRHGPTEDGDRASLVVILVRFTISTSQFVQRWQKINSNLRR